MKTVADYLNDPRILNDPAMAGALEPIRRIHAIRLKMQDESAGMTVEERSAMHKENANAFFASLGLPPPQYVNMTGQGKLKPRAAGIT
ncbi:hypothetical protein, partial [Treponema sp. R6D11]